MDKHSYTSDKADNPPPYTPKAGVDSSLATATTSDEKSYSRYTEGTTAFTVVASSSTSTAEEWEMLCEKHLEEQKKELQDIFDTLQSQVNNLEKYYEGETTMDSILCLTDELRSILPSFEQSDKHVRGDVNGRSSKLCTSCNSLNATLQDQWPTVLNSLAERTCMKQEATPAFVGRESSYTIVALPLKTYSKRLHRVQRFHHMDPRELSTSLRELCGSQEFDLKTWQRSRNHSLYYHAPTSEGKSKNAKPYSKLCDLCSFNTDWLSHLARSLPKEPGPHKRIGTDLNVAVITEDTVEALHLFAICEKLHESIKAQCQATAQRQKEEERERILEERKAKGYLEAQLTPQTTERSSSSSKGKAKLGSLFGKSKR